MLKKSTKPQSNSFICVQMMLSGAKKRRMIALSAIKAINNGSRSNSNVLMFK